MAQLYMTTRKTIALTIQTFVGKVMSLLFGMLSGFVIAFLLRRKSLFISWLQSLSAVTLEPKKTQSVTVSIFSAFTCGEVMGPDAMLLVGDQSVRKWENSALRSPSSGWPCG